MASEQDSLTEKVKRTLSENAGNLFISSISAFEIAIKSEKGKWGYLLDSGRYYM